MTYILRMFFFSLGLVLLLSTWAMDPVNAQFKDLVALIHTSNFWQTVGLASYSLIGADLVFSGKWAAIVETTFDIARRLRKGRESAATL